MRRSGHTHARSRRAFWAAVAVAILAAATLVAAAAAVVAPSPAGAATLSGKVKGCAGYSIVVVQASGKAQKRALTATTGKFSIKGVKPASASVQLVNPDGSYYGPVVLKATAKKAYAFIKGAASLKLGTVRLKGGYAVAGVPATRVQTKAAYAAKAVKRKPIGAGKLGRVMTAEPMGYRGDSVDLDLDGVIGAFDIDDNGNQIIDNVDRTGRGANRPSAPGIKAASATPLAGPRRISGGPPPLTPAGTFFLFSNFWPNSGGPSGPVKVPALNANIAAIKDLDALIDQYMPSALSLAMEAPDGTPAQFDGLGNSYIAAHVVDGITYPLVGMDSAAPTYTADGLLNLLSDPRHPSGCPLKPGARTAEIGAGDCFVMTTSSGAKYPGTLNFVFNTVPALKSYQFDNQVSATAIEYGEDGVQLLGGVPQPTGVRVVVPTGATKVTLSFWRPQRKAAPGEAASAAGWVDIGKLWYEVGTGEAPSKPGVPPSGTLDPAGAVSNETANGAPIPPTKWPGGFLDPTADLAADPANTLTFTFDLAKCYSSWPSVAPEMTFWLELQCAGGYGDNALTRVYFVVQ